MPTIKYTSIPKLLKYFMPYRYKNQYSKNKVNRILLFYV